MRAAENQFIPGKAVAYIPDHAQESDDEPFKNQYIECGIVSSAPMAGHAFVKFFEDIARLGWDGCTAKGCSTLDLMVLGEKGLYYKSRQDIEQFIKSKYE